jgi:hypothetical protein
MASQGTFAGLFDEDGGMVGFGGEAMRAATALIWLRYSGASTRGKVNGSGRVIAYHDVLDAPPIQPEGQLVQGTTNESR